MPKRDVWTWYRQGHQAKKLCLKSEFDSPSSKRAQADGIHCLEWSMRSREQIRDEFEKQVMKVALGY